MHVNMTTTSTKEAYMGKLEFEAIATMMGTIRDLELLRERLDVERLNVAVTEGALVIGFSVDLPESAVAEVELVDRIERILQHAGCYDVAHLAMRR